MLSRFFSSNLFNFYSIINDDTIIFGFQFSENAPETRTLKITAEKVPFGTENDFYINYINTGYLDKYNIDVRKLNMDRNIKFEKLVLPIKYGNIINNYVFTT